MSDFKQNFTNILIGKRLEIVKCKNDKLISEIVKHQKQREATLLDGRLRKSKRSQKVIPTYHRDHLSLHNYYIDRQTSYNHCTFKSVKIPISKLVPITIDQIRQKIRML